jgi:hypothetical protein
MYLGEKTWEEIKSRPTFFALCKDVAENEYGVTYEFITDNEYHLLALDHKETVSKLLLTINDIKIRKIIELHYGIKSTRNSNLGDDILLTNYLCSMGYEGYATKEMNTDFRGKCHAEIMICDPKNITAPIQVTVEKEKIDKIIKKYKEEKIARKLKEQRDENKKKQKSVFFIEDTEDFDLGFPKFQKESTFSPLRTQSQLFHSPVRTQSQLFHSPVRTQSQLFHSPVRTQSQLFHSPVRTPVRTNKMLFQYNSPSPNKTNKLYKTPPSSNKKNKTPIKKGGKAQKQKQKQKNTKTRKQKN